MLKLEPTRTREQGTKVTLALTGPAIITALRDIVERKQYAKINGAMVDLYTASAIVKVYDALNDANKAKLAAQPLPKMATIAFKLIA